MQVCNLPGLRPTDRPVTLPPPAECNSVIQRGAAEPQPKSGETPYRYW
jgi:hypothetical protein